MKKILLSLVLILPIFYLSCVFSKDNQHKNWNTYTDNKFNFIIQCPKDFEIEFWRDKEEPDPYFGVLTNNYKGITIDFCAYKAEKGETLEHFVRKSANEDIYFREKKIFNKIPIIRIGAHYTLEDGEYYELTQSIKIKDYFITINAEITKDSMKKKDDKYKLIIEIMDTFKVL